MPRQESGAVPLSSVAWFVSPHGFGHAARAAAVMEALSARVPGIRHEIFTTVPAWFFSQTLGEGGFSLHRLVSDVGLVQATPFREDVPASIEKLRAFYPLDRHLVGDLAGTLRSQGCRLVVCDISPLGLAAAKEAGVPSVLVENFTWDWIYRGYIELDRRFEELADIVGALFSLADYRVQCEPLCARADAALTAPPTARAFRAGPGEIKEALGIPPEERMVLLTSGGIQGDWSHLDGSAVGKESWVVVPGGAAERQRRGRLILLPHHSSLYHPDLVKAADAVVGKVGYSTLAEVWHGGVPFGFVLREHFRETESLGEFVRERMSGVEVPESDLLDGSWTAALPELLALPRTDRGGLNGADLIAEFLLYSFQRSA